MFRVCLIQVASTTIAAVFSRIGEERGLRQASRYNAGMPMLPRLAGTYNLVYGELHGARLPCASLMRKVLTPQPQQKANNCIAHCKKKGHNFYDMGSKGGFPCKVELKDDGNWTYCGGYQIWMDHYVGPAPHFVMVAEPLRRIASMCKCAIVSLLHKFIVFLSFLVALYYSCRLLRGWLHKAEGPCSWRHWVPPDFKRTAVY